MELIFNKIEVSYCNNQIFYKDMSLFNISLTFCLCSRL